ncbi:tyrosyl-trna synthetase, partial [Pseudomonas sp. LJDD11]|nr:tyrosyl-trna synthetase [Pseudomonas sp. LJDD11]
YTTTDQMPMGQREPAAPPPEPEAKPPVEKAAKPGKAGAQGKTLDD